MDPVLEKVDRYLQLIRELDVKLVKASGHSPACRSRSGARCPPGPDPVHNGDGRAERR